VRAPNLENYEDLESNLLDSNANNMRERERERESQTTSHVP
jgi:hypothetical protein